MSDNKADVDMLFEIHTTRELDNVIYFADGVEIEHSFIKFKPLRCISRKKQIEMKDVTIILPDRNISQIIFKKVTPPKDKKLVKKQKSELNDV